MLVGRAPEQGALEDLLTRARGGHSGVLAFVGEAGIGKSALLAYAERRADGMRVLRARGISSEAHIPFAGLFELLRAALGTLDAIPTTQAHALQSALALRPAQAQDRFAVGAATLSLLTAYAESGPLLLLVDDAHWLDGSSADTVLFAVRRLIADPIAVVLAWRPGESPRFDQAGLPTWRVNGLDRAAAGELLRHRGSATLSGPAIDQLQGETGGNPLALLEFGTRPLSPEQLTIGAPPLVVSSVARVYVDRFRDLPQATRDVLVLAATSDSGDVPLIARGAGVLGREVMDMLPAERAGLVQIELGRLVFCHPLARSAIYGAAAPEQRRAAHRALAMVLPDAELDRRAWHMALATLTPDESVAAALAEAGQRARDRSAYDVASRAFERAAQLAPESSQQGPLLFAAADAAWLAGLGEHATALLEAARERVATVAQAIDIDQLRGHIAARQGPIARAQALLFAAAERAAEVDPDRAVVLFAEALNASFYAGDAAAMQRAATRASALSATRTDGQTRFFGLITRGMAAIIGGQGESGATLIREATAVLDRSDELRADPRLLAWAAMGPLWLREADQGARLAERALSIVRQTAAVGVLPYLLGHVGIDHFARDRWPAAEAAFTEAIDVARETGQNTELAVSLARLAWLEARQGRVDLCHQHANEALSLARDLGLGVSEVWATAALGELEMVAGSPHTAVAHFERQLALLAARKIDDVDLSAAPELVELYLRLGRRADAVAIAQRHEHGARTKGQPWALGRAIRSCALVADTERSAVELFEQAVAAHARTADLFERSRTHLVYGATLRRHRQRVRARAQLRLALEGFDRLGAAPWSDRARVELAATGETTSRRTPSALNALTPQELQVALRLAGGLTTRETAAALFLSPKTVEYHLRSVYRKLEIGSRPELTALLDRGRDRRPD